MSDNKKSRALQYWMRRIVYIYGGLLFLQLGSFTLGPMHQYFFTNDYIVNQLDYEERDNFFKITREYLDRKSFCDLLTGLAVRGDRLVIIRQVSRFAMRDTLCEILPVLSQSRFEEMLAVDSAFGRSVGGESFNENRRLAWERYNDAVQDRDELLKLCKDKSSEK